VKVYSAPDSPSLRRRNLAYNSCNAHISITVRIFRVETIDAACCLSHYLAHF
jgi:hypothetical protein